MAGKIKISELRKFDIAEYLDDDNAIAEYLNDAIAIAEEKGDFTPFKAAMNNIARARGMAEIAKKSGLGRESLYKALDPKAQPRFETMQRVFSSMGLKMTLSPVDKRGAQDDKVKPSPKAKRLSA